MSACGGNCVMSLQPATSAAAPTSDPKKNRFVMVLVLFIQRGR
jgi:hypothetical protein